MSGEKNDKNFSIIPIPDDHLSIKLAWWLDERFKIPGTKYSFGFDEIIGALIPGAGDIVTTLIGFYLILTCYKHNIPSKIIRRMILHLIIDLLIGLLPVGGDIADFIYKSNKKNVKLLKDNGFINKK